MILLRPRSLRKLLPSKPPHKPRRFQALRLSRGATRNYRGNSRFRRQRRKDSPNHLETVPLKEGMIAAPSHLRIPNRAITRTMVSTASTGLDQTIIKASVDSAIAIEDSESAGHVLPMLPDHKSGSNFQALVPPSRGGSSDLTSKITLALETQGVRRSPVLQIPRYSGPDSTNDAGFGDNGNFETEHGHSITDQVVEATA